MLSLLRREEQYFDREEVLGRDAASVFPTESKKAAAQGAGLAELLGANKKVRCCCLSVDIFV